MSPIPPTEVMCHRTGFAESCRSLVTSGKCTRWLQLRGIDPNTGQEFDRHDCIDNWTPILLVENSQMQRQTGAAIESFRNEMVLLNEQSFALMQQRQEEPHRISQHHPRRARKVKLIEGDKS